MTRLSVNVNKLATLRNARGKNHPNVLQTTLDIISYGAEGITVHPRPDGRHIRQEDVVQIKQSIAVELNIEGYPSAEFLDFVKTIKPAQCTLVPDPPHVLTSNAGWAIEKNKKLLCETVKSLHESGIRVSLFIDPFSFSTKDLECLVLTGTDRIELYTERYADDYATEKSTETLKTYLALAEMIHAQGIEINAGHDLNLLNLRAFIQAIPFIKEVSIGHALICDALQYGLRETIKKYLDCLQDGHSER